MRTDSKLVVAAHPSVIAVLEDLLRPTVENPTTLKAAVRDWLRQRGKGLAERHLAEGWAVQHRYYVGVVAGVGLTATVTEFTESADKRLPARFLRWLGGVRIRRHRVNFTRVTSAGSADLISS
jgi:hypothetical protein